MRIFLLLIGFLCFNQSIKAQELFEYFSFKEMYPDAGVICTQYTCNLEISVKDNKPYIVYETYEEFLYFTDQNSGYQKRSFHVSHLYDLKSYSAELLVPGRIGYLKVPVTDFQVNDFESNHIFYDDSKELNFTFHTIGKGYKTVIKNRYEIKDAHFLPKFSLSPHLDYVNFTFKVKIGKGVQIGLDSFQTQFLKWKPDTLVKGKYTTYTWKGSSDKFLNYEIDAPNRNYFSPQLHVRVKSYLNGKDTIPIMGNLNDLYKWNCHFVQQTTEVAARFKTMSDSIVGDASTNKEKAARIYEWVQKNIRYIALEYGDDGFIPAKASTVYKERYGDCKGMSNLLFKLLRSQGLEAYLVWIGTRDIPYSYDKLVSNSVSNHMITALKMEGKWLFLDGTASNLPFGMPSPFIQEKQGMIDLGDCNGYVLETVPKASADENYTYDSCFATLDGRTLKGSGIAQFHGFKKMVFADKLNERNYRSIFAQCRNFVMKGNNRFILDTVWLENLDDRNLPLNIHYQFHIPDYALMVDKEYYVNLNLDRPDIPNKIELKRNMPIAYRFAGKDINVLCFEIPQNYKTDSLPSSVTYDKSNFYFENNYQSKGRQIWRRQVYQTNQLVLKPEEFKEHNALVDYMIKNYSNLITLHP